VETSPSRIEYEGETPQLFEPVPAERPPRRLSKAESLAYVRIIRARLHRADDRVAGAARPGHHDIDLDRPVHRRVA
jgi:hypothetical protein